MSKPQLFSLIKRLGWMVMFSSLATVAGQSTSSNKPAVKAPETSPRASHLSFDVVSIRESDDGNISYIDNPPNASFYHSNRISVSGLIRGAYNLKIMRLLENVPNWAMTVRYDVTAKSDGKTDVALAKLADADAYEEKRAMLREMLAERFKLKVHPETRMSTTYELVATPPAATLMTQIQGDIAKTVSTCGGQFFKSGYEVNAKGCPFAIFLSNVRQELGTDVVDHTGLSGAYAYHLMYAPRDQPMREGEDRYPDLAVAVREQLGLELKKKKGLVTFWVVDHLERPTAN